MKRVFCIGFHKTGTKSLALALRQLGYRVTGPNGVHDPDIAHNVYSLVERLLPQYDAFQDNPWPILYPHLDRMCPGSRFVLTLRNSDAWIESQLRHFGAEETPMRTWIYGAGCPQGNEARYLARYESHNREVLDYFKGRPGDFLVMNLVKGDGWEKLCAFLDTPTPEGPFPHANRAEHRERMAAARDRPAIRSRGR